jgi:hypothetical protein
MKRTAVNMVVDAAAFVAFVLLVSTGLLVRYQLPPGSGDPTRGGLGRGAMSRPITLLWGLSRHQWGDIHYWIALALVAILAVHLVVHWKWIVCVARGQKTDASGLRLGLGAVGLAAVALFALMPLLSGTQSVPRSVLWQETTRGEAATGGEQGDNLSGRQGQRGGGGSLRGSMTLREAADEYQVPVAVAAQRLGLPEDVSPEARLGQLGQQYGFRMGDARRALERPDEP